MKFTLEINCDNAAFDPNGNTEIARILRDTADKVESEQLDGPLRDINGNRVGKFKMAGR